MKLDLATYLPDSNQNEITLPESNDYTSQDEFIQLKLDQLNVASSSNILFFIRDRSFLHLAKKLKIEFNKVFVCSEMKEAMKLLNKITNETQETALRIDLVIA